MSGVLRTSRRADLLNLLQEVRLALRAARSVAYLPKKLFRSDPFRPHCAHALRLEGLIVSGALIAAPDNGGVPYLRFWSALK